MSENSSGINWDDVFRAGQGGSPPPQPPPQNDGGLFDDFPPPEPKPQPTLKDAREAADIGIEQSSRSSGDEWKTYAIEFVRCFLIVNQTMHVDELWETGLREPKSSRGLGAVIQHAISEGWIEYQEFPGGSPREEVCPVEWDSQSRLEVSDLQELRGGD